MQSSEGARPGEKRVSQLLKPLWNCLHEQSSPLSILEYLIQFMASRDAVHLLQFWFSVASFRNAAPSHSGADTRHTDTGHCTPATPGVQVDKNTLHTLITQPYHTAAEFNIRTQTECTAVPASLLTTPGTTDSGHCSTEAAPSGVSITGAVSGRGINGVAGRGEGGGGRAGHAMTHRPPDVSRQTSLSKQASLYQRENKYYNIIL